MGFPGKISNSNILMLFYLKQDQTLTSVQVSKVFIFEYFEKMFYYKYEVKKIIESFSLS